MWLGFVRYSFLTVKAWLLGDHNRLEVCRLPGQSVHITAFTNSQERSSTFSNSITPASLSSVLGNITMKSFSFGNVSFGAVVNLLILMTCLTQAYAALRGDDCEVCIKVLNRFQETLKDDQKGDAVKIEKSFRKFCKGVKGKDERFCYYLGGMETSATKIVGEMAKPLSYSKPIEKICEELKKRDVQICELKYDKQVDFTTVDFHKLKVRDLKKILTDWGEDDACKGCAEKSDFIRKIMELLPKYAPEAASRREEL